MVAAVSRSETFTLKCVILLFCLPSSAYKNNTTTAAGGNVFTAHPAHLPRTGKPDLSGYCYGAIFSRAFTADRSANRQRDKELNGAPESLVGRINPNDMGSRVQQQAPKDLEKKKKKVTELKDASEKAGKRRAAEAGFGYSDIIEATQDLEGLTYRPSTTETREVYELILLTVHQAAPIPTLLYNNLLCFIRDLLVIA